MYTNQYKKNATKAKPEINGAMIEYESPITVRRVILGHCPSNLGQHDRRSDASHIALTKVPQATPFMVYLMLKTDRGVEPRMKILT